MAPHKRNSASTPPVAPPAPKRLSFRAGFKPKAGQTVTLVVDRVQARELVEGGPRNTSIIQHLGIVVAAQRRPNFTRFFDIILSDDDEDISEIPSMKDAWVAAQDNWEDMQQFNQFVRRITVFDTPDDFSLDMGARIKLLRTSTHAFSEERGYTCCANYSKLTVMDS